MNKTHNIKEYRRNYYLSNREKLIAQNRAIALKKAEFLKGYNKAYWKFSKIIKALKAEIAFLERSNVKPFGFVSPEGELVSGINLCKFCRDRNLSVSSMRDLKSGKISQHKGWRKYVEGMELAPFIPKPKIDRKTYLRKYYKEHREEYIAQAMAFQAAKKAEKQAKTGQ